MIEESIIEWNNQQQQFMYSRSKFLNVKYINQTYDFELNLEFIASVLFALWATNVFFNKCRMLLISIFYANDLLNENGDTFIFSTPQMGMKTNSNTYL